MWINRARSLGTWVPVLFDRGGDRRRKIQPHHVDYLVSVLENNCLLTLADMMDILETKFGVRVCQQTVRNALEAAAFTYKKTHAEPSEMNTDRVKELRRKYVLRIMEYRIMELQAQRKRILYFDETNFKLFCHRNFGWSRKGERAVVIWPEARGQSLQVIACISAFGLEHYELRWGTNDAPVIDAFVRDLLTKLLYGGALPFRHCHRVRQRLYPQWRPRSLESSRVHGGGASTFGLITC